MTAGETLPRIPPRDRDQNEGEEGSNTQRNGQQDHRCPRSARQAHRQRERPTAPQACSDSQAVNTMRLRRTRTASDHPVQPVTGGGERTLSRHGLLAGPLPETASATPPSIPSPTLPCTFPTPSRP